MYREKPNKCCFIGAFNADFHSANFGATRYAGNRHLARNSSIPGWLTDVQGALFFSAFDGGINGNELWTSDGTTAGTVQVEDINPGASNSNPSSLVNRNGTLFFTATDNVVGNELWALQSPIDIILTPINPPIQIPAGGGSFQLIVTASNISAVSKSTQFWNAITLPSGEVIGPTIGPITVTLPSGDLATPTVTQNVPAAAPAGQYTYTFNVGTFPNTIDDSDSFTFTKSTGPAAKSFVGSESATNWDAKWDAETSQAVTDEFIPEAFVLEQNYWNRTIRILSTHRRRLPINCPLQKT